MEQTLKWAPYRTLVGKTQKHAKEGMVRDEE